MHANVFITSEEESVDTEVITDFHMWHSLINATLKHWFDDKSLVAKLGFKISKGPSGLAQ